MNTIETREIIKHRMLQEVARQWGYSESAMETTAFDPLVDLLLGALATESERVYHEVEASRGRMLERLVQILLPEVFTGPRPASAVLAAQSVEPLGEVSFTDAFTSRHPQLGTDVGLAPAGRFSVVNGRVACLATGQQLWRIDPAQNRLPVAQTPPHRRLADYTLWLGLELGPGLPPNAPLTVYFDWKNLPQLDQYLHHLPQTHWFVGDTALTVSPGLPSVPDRDLPPVIQTMQQHAQRTYQPHFMTINAFPPGQAGAPPAALADAFEPALLQSLPPVVWLRIHFPPLFSPDVLSRTECVLNAFPVLNLQTDRVTFRLSEWLNIFPVTTELPLVDIADVTDSEGNVYKPFTEAGDPAARSFALRHQSVGRFDSRNATEMVTALLDQLRDESAAFVALGYDSLRSNIEDIQRHLQKIRQNMPPLPPGDPVPYLVVNNAPATGTLFVRYWTTAAERANRLPAGTRVDSTAPAFRRESLQLLRSLQSGAARLNPATSLPVFRQVMLTRGRALTLEDIRAICRATAPDSLEQVDVQKGYIIGADPRQGLSRTLDVQLTFKPASRLSPDEIEQIRREISVQLENQWTGVLPIRVLSATEPTR